MAGQCGSAQVGCLLTTEGDKLIAVRAQVSPENLNN
jgi:hypothetical protein